MFTRRVEVAAVGVFVATVSVLGLCFAVWHGDYHEFNESKSAEISQLYKAQPAIHPQLDENEEVSMRKTVLDLHGAFPEAVVKFSALLENVTPPTEIHVLSENDKAAIGDETYAMSDTLCAPENLILTEGECKTAATALEHQYHTDDRPDDSLPEGCLYMAGEEIQIWNPALDSKISIFPKGTQCICKIPAAATGGKKLDKAHRICLNTHLNELDATYETALFDYKTKKGKDFVVGPVTQWSTAYANANADQSLADEDFLKVAAAKANFDGLFFYMKTSHAIEICGFAADEDNQEAVKANPVLFNLPKSQCAKVISAVDDFETGAGKELLSKCNEAVIEAPEPVAPEPACVDEDTTGNTAWEALKTIAEQEAATKADSCADLAKYCHNGPREFQRLTPARVQAVCHASCGTCR